MTLETMIMIFSEYLAMFLYPIALNYKEATFIKPLLLITTQKEVESVQ